MIAEERTPLMVKPWSGRGEEPKEPYVVRDCQGSPIYEGDYVVAIKDWQWGKKGGLMKVTGASEGSYSPSVYILQKDGSSTALSAEIVLVANHRDLEFELAWCNHRLGRVVQQRRELKVHRDEIKSQIAGLVWQKEQREAQREVG